ncbi:E3 ubiquitin-protein ligase RNF31 isoform X2 [Antennarius striatus]|uniref:E3 ubiquitin-protein ligase RNF31 isoform X2 n=1 Tax=Antennarius striatus TaxID=241820 RepID=UPI0035B38AB1
MPRVRPEAELRTLKELLYTRPAETLSDLQMVRSVFPDLHLFVDVYCFPNKVRKRLVYLKGTITCVPVHHEGRKYLFPVCIWLHETHPVSRPRCYVCPSVSMVINPSCPWVDAVGNVLLDALKNWTHGVSNLLLLVSEMRNAFQNNTPLYSRHALQAPPPGDGSRQHPTSSPSSSPSGQTANQSGRSKERRSYTEELQGIDFSTPSSSSSVSLSWSSSSSDALSRMVGALKLDPDQPGGPVVLVPGPGPDGGPGTPAAHPDHMKVGGWNPASNDPNRMSAAHNFLLRSQMLARLPQDRAAMFLSLMSLEGRSFLPSDVMEAVQLNRDFPSALKFLTHNCPICQEQVSFSKIVTMTHCSCFLCQTCFKTFFSSAIKEKSISQLVCPQCGKPEVKGHGGFEESMDYFNLLDTQIRHFLPPEIHELFQRKLRDRALQEMPNFRWCAHCSFGMLHEADRLRMDCPSCKKSTCCQCRLPWSPQHQGLSCDQFRVWQQQNQPDSHGTALQGGSSIECPSCRFVFGLSRGGCLHFTCSLCQHQFCGGCSRPFRPGSACGFSAGCATRGLHAHHPRDCLYHLRDWSPSRLHLLLQHYRASPTWLEAANGSAGGSGQTGVCLVLELKDDASWGERPCGRHAPPEHRGYCQVHYKERLVELVHRCHGDPAVLFSLAEMKAELQRWNLMAPERSPDEPKLMYEHRLRQLLTRSLPLTKSRPPPLRDT